MNIDKGANVLEYLSSQKKIQVPYKFKTFRYSALPDFNLISQDSSNGISIYLGLPQGWTNGSLYEILIKYLGVDRTRIEDTVVSQHCLSTSQVNTFLADAKERVKIALYKNYLDNISVPDDFRGVSYQSWINSQVEYSYFVQIENNPNNARYLVQIDKGNPDGWKFQPKICFLKTDSGIQVDSQISDFGDEILTEILDQSNIIGKNLSHTLDNIIVEGKIMNNTYPVSRVMAIDIYRGYSNHTHKNLNHQTLINLFEKA